MNTLELNSRDLRRARTRSLVQIGGLCHKSGLLETFGIVLGLDLQKDIAMKEPIAALFKALLTLNDLAQSGELHLPLLARQGLEELRNRNQLNSSGRF